MHMSPFTDIIESCHYVCKQAKHVHINYDVLDKLLIKGIEEGNYWGSSNKFNSLDLNIETIVNYRLLYQAIGFSFWGNPKWTIKTDDNEEYDGSDALLYVFIKNIEVFSNFSRVEKMTFAEFSKMMKGNVEIPLLRERYDILIRVSHIVNERMNGNFFEFIKDITDDRELSKLIIDNFEDFIDIRELNGKKIYFYKLASLVTSDILHARKIKEGINVDYSHIAGCPDYKIPQIMRNLGITSYSQELSNIVDNKIEIEEGSIYEIEIRASVIEVVQYIVKKTGICGIEANDYLWLMSKKVKSKSPYHLTRTTSY